MTMWRPGRGVTPSMAEARAHVENPRQRDRMLTRRDAAALGWRSADSNVQGQRTLDLGDQNLPETEKLPSWSSLPKTQADTKGLRGEGSRTSQEGVSRLMKDRYGLSMEQAEANQAALLDRGLERAHRSGAEFPEGAAFYADEHNVISRSGRHLGVEPSQMIEATAVMSPRNPYFESGRRRNLESTEKVVEDVVAGRSPDYYGTAGLPESVEKAERVISEGKTAKELTKSRVAMKVPSFASNLRNPWDREGRTTIDAHAVQGMTGLPAGEAEAAIRPIGGYEFFDEANRRAARRRGLSPEEAQSVAWHQKKYEDEQTNRYRGARIHTVESSLQTGESPGQLGLFGEDVPTGVTRGGRNRGARKKVRPQQYTEEDWKGQPL